jgi:hypothetical protein
MKYLVGLAFGLMMSAQTVSVDVSFALTDNGGKPLPHEPVRLVVGAIPD